MRPSHMRVSMKLLTKREHFVQTLRKKLLKMVKPRMAKAVAAMNEFIREKLKEQVRMHPTYVDLVYGSLGFELGVVNPYAAMENILEEWVEKVEISIPKVIGQTMTITLRAASSDYHTLVKSDDAEYDTDKGKMIPWLKWLLLEQDVIAQYSVKFGSSPSSRTGGAIMIKTGRNWMVRGEHAGSASDNFLIQSVRAILPEVQTFGRTTFMDILNG